MKTAFELAMERLNKKEPSVKLSPAQKEALAELDAKFAAKIAEREIFLKSRIAEAIAQGDTEELNSLEAELARDRRTISAELEEAKNKIRAGSGEAS